MENLDVEMAEEIVKLKEENKVLKKALELACECIKQYEQRDDREIYGLDYEIDYDIDTFSRDFIDQAKESLDVKD